MTNGADCICGRLLVTFLIISSYVNVTLMFAGQFKSLFSVDYNLSAYLSDSVIDDATLLDTAGRWYAAAELFTRI